MRAGGGAAFAALPGWLWWWKALLGERARAAGAALPAPPEPKGRGDRHVAPAAAEAAAVLSGGGAGGGAAAGAGAGDAAGDGPAPLLLGLPPPALPAGEPNEMEHGSAAAGDVTGAPVTAGPNWAAGGGVAADVLEAWAAGAAGEVVMRSGGSPLSLPALRPALKAKPAGGTAPLVSVKHAAPGLPVNHLDLSWEGRGSNATKHAHL